MNIVDLEKQAEECLAQGKYDRAIFLYEKLIDSAPNLKINYWKLGLVLLLQGREEEANTCWFSALFTGDPEEIEQSVQEFIGVLEIEGAKRLEAGKYTEAEKIYLQILEQDTTSAIAYKSLGNALYNQGKLEEAISFYQQGIELQPNEAITYYNLGNAFHQLDKLEEAIAHYQRYLAFDPNSATVLNNLGNACQRQGKFEQAISCYQKSIALDSNNAFAYNNLGSIFNVEGKLEEALACFKQGLALEPSNVEAYNNLAVFYQNSRQYDLALKYCDLAIKIDMNYADVHFTMAIILLRLGDYKRGLAEYEWRRKRKENPLRIFSKPVWDGSNIAGKTILLQAEQGMGDVIQFIRYVPELLKLGCEIVLECHPPLVKLMENMVGVKKVVAIGDTLPEVDLYIPLLSLPLILETTIETIPAKIPYLNNLESVSIELDNSGDNFWKVGLVWAGNPKHLDDRKRSSSLKYFLPLLNTPNISFYSLQKEPKSAEIKELSAPVNLVDLSSRINDFADTAAVISQLDLVIAVDTAVAHLAGAMGKPVWVILCYNADWRWMIDREDSPWYPSVRLFRQNSPGNWQEVLERVRQALSDFTCNLNDTI